MFDPINVAIGFGRFLQQLPFNVRAPLIGGVAIGCLEDAPEEVRVEFVEELAHRFNLGFFRVERPNKEVDTGATTKPGPEHANGLAVYLGRILPAGNA